MHPSTLLLGAIAMVSTVNAKEPTDVHVVLYTGPRLGGNSWDFAGNPYVCKKVGNAVYHDVISASLEYHSPPKGFYCRLYSSDDCAQSTWTGAQLTSTLPKLLAIFRSEVGSIKCGIF
ncbi:hypothetical protein GGI43DRAFT_398731 [Trichoderma evansii]